MTSIKEMAEALALGLHHRVGADSPVYMLGPYVVKEIMDYFSGGPVFLVNIRDPDKPLEYMICNYKESDKTWTTKVFTPIKDKSLIPMLWVDNLILFYTDVFGSDNHLSVYDMSDKSLTHVDNFTYYSFINYVQKKKEPWKVLIRTYKPTEPGLGINEEYQYDLKKKSLVKITGSNIDRMDEEPISPIVKIGKVYAGREFIKDSWPFDYVYSDGERFEPPYFGDMSILIPQYCTS